MCMHVISVHIKKIINVSNFFLFKAEIFKIYKFNFEKEYGGEIC